VKKRWQFSLIFFNIVMLCLGMQSTASQDSHYACNISCKGGPTKVTRGIGDALYDVGLMFRYFLDWDSYKTVVATFPFFAAGQMIDESVHEMFYDKKTHKNIYKVHDCFNDAADRYIVDSISALSIASFLFSHNQRLRQTSKMFLLGLPFITLTTNLVKKYYKVDICYRPLHEKYSIGFKRSYGGFPSTHAAQITYATVLFGAQFGLKAALPLVAAGVGIAVPFVIDNRHYISQLVAGAGLGVLYGLAANKVIDKRCCNSALSFNIDIDAYAKPSCSLSYLF
jgi:membrane-associated phospholipid phosphatase